jgi:hypothetical protein
MAKDADANEVNISSAKINLDCGGICECNNVPAELSDPLLTLTFLAGSAMAVARLAKTTKAEILIL